MLEGFKVVGSNDFSERLLYSMGFFGWLSLVYSFLLYHGAS